MKLPLKGRLFRWQLHQKRKVGIVTETQPSHPLYLSHWFYGDPWGWGNKQEPGGQCSYWGFEVEAGRQSETGAVANRTRKYGLAASLLQTCALVGDTELQASICSYQRSAGNDIVRKRGCLHSSALGAHVFSLQGFLLFPEIQFTKAVSHPSTKAQSGRIYLCTHY